MGGRQALSGLQCTTHDRIVKELDELPTNWARARVNAFRAGMAIVERCFGILNGPQKFTDSGYS